MTELDLLQDLLVIMAAALLVVGVLHRVGVPSLAGFIVAGTLVGPHALGLVTDLHQVEVLAEVGVVLLLFGIGLELSVDRLRQIWRIILVGGALQMALTIAAVTAGAVAVGLPPRAAIFAGCVIAVSSTAIVLRGLSTRGELHTPHGRVAMSILVFQDLAVVPMMLAIPLLAAGDGVTLDSVWTLLTAAVVLAGVLLAASALGPRLLLLASRTRQRELLVLAVGLLCLGTAWLVSLAGISLALGAFLAGLVVAGSDFRHQALAELVPLRDVLASIFFVSIGMLLDVGDVLQHMGPILGLLGAIVLGKLVLVFITTLLIRRPLRVAILSSTALAQVGEFSFVLLRAADGSGLLSERAADNLTVAIILSMLVTPFALAAGPRLAAASQRLRSWLSRGQGHASGRSLQTLSGHDEPAGEAHGPGSLQDHVIVAGYGLAGQQLAVALKGCGKPFVVVDINSNNVREARRAGLHAEYGDVTSVEVLEGVAAAHARKLVVAINDQDATCRAIRAARRTAPNLHIVARAHYVADVPRLRRAGASEVVTSEAEAAVELTSRVLQDYCVAVQQIDRERTRIRGEATSPSAGSA